MIIRTQLTSIAASLVLLLTAIRGRLLFCVLKYGSVVSSVRIATEYIQSNNKDTTLVTTYNEPSENLLVNTDLTSNPEEELQGIIEGCQGADEISLGRWLQLITMASIGGDQKHINIDIPYGGGIYSMHHCVTKLIPPADVESITENKH